MKTEVYIKCDHGKSLNAKISLRLFSNPMADSESRFVPRRIRSITMGVVFERSLSYAPKHFRLQNLISNSKHYSIFSYLCAYFSYALESRLGVGAVKNF